MCWFSSSILRTLNFLPGLSVLIQFTAILKTKLPSLARRLIGTQSFSLALMLMLLSSLGQGRRGGRAGRERACSQDNSWDSVGCHSPQTWLTNSKIKIINLLTSNALFPLYLLPWLIIRRCFYNVMTPINIQNPRVGSFGKLPGKASLLAVLSPVDNPTLADPGFYHHPIPVHNQDTDMPSLWSNPPPIVSTCIF